MQGRDKKRGIGVFVSPGECFVKELELVSIELYVERVSQNMLHE
jgi:hypothetical protein